MRFQAGEIARFVIARVLRPGHSCPRECTILYRGPAKPGDMVTDINGNTHRAVEPFDYIIDSPPYLNDGGHMRHSVLVMDWQLAKLDDPQPGFETEEDEELEEVR